MKNKNKLTTFAIIIPAKNEEKNISTCLDSVLKQTFDDWVCCVLNDGITDNTYNIVREYAKKDRRFIIVNSKYNKYNKDGSLNCIEKDMAGISNMLNLGISITKSKYIVRMDADDEMLPDRLQITYDWMESHPDCDIAGFPVIWKGKTYNLSSYTNNGVCTWKGMMQNIKPYHPTVCMRRYEVMEKTKFLYQQPYDGIEDAVLWFHSMMWGCKIMLADTEPVIIYKGGNSNEIMTDLFNRVCIAYEQQTIEDENVLLHYNYLNESKLTCVIGFKNEGIEVEKTVLSLLISDFNIDIVLVDDASDDGYDYKRVADTFGCKYVRNEKSLGCAGARNVGVEYVTTPYFMLMDAHMRFNIYNKAFSSRFVKELDKDPNQFVQCNTCVIRSNAEEDGHFRHYVNEDCLSQPMGAACVGAFYHQAGDGRDWAGDWCYKRIDNNKYKYSENKDTNLCIPIVCLMGADYATSKVWWKKIGGLRGLGKWGHDEPLLSLKTQIMGGKLMTFPNYAIGHLYRTTPVYGTLPASESNSNLLFVQYLMSHAEKDGETDESLFNIYKERMRERLGNETFNDVMNVFNNKKEEYDEIKKYIWDNAKISVSDILAFQNRLE